MHEPRVSHIENSGALQLRVPPALRIGCLALAVIGLLAFLVSAFTGDDASRLSAWSGYFVSVLFFFFLAMGAASFLAIQYVTSAKWYVVLKRLPEALSSFAWKGGAILVLFTILGIGSLYTNWSTVNPAKYYPYEGTAKAVWLSPMVHIVKVIIYISALTVVTFLLVKASRDTNGDSATLRLRRMKVAIPFLMVFAFAFSLFAWDAVMSIEPKWFSTMFGVYCFSGALVSALALMMLLSIWMRGRTEGHIRHRHMYDLGTYVMAFATFMMYIGFSQFMLIWYANIPDETLWYMNRYEGGWGPWLIALPILKWVIPFLLLMPPPFRTNITVVTLCCLSVLFGQLVDIYLLVMPAYYGEFVVPGLVHILTFLGVGGLFGWSTLGTLAARPLLPVGDPDLLNSVNGDYLHA